MNKLLKVTLIMYGMMIVAAIMLYAAYVTQNVYIVIAEQLVTIAALIFYIWGYKIAMGDD